MNTQLVSVKTGNEVYLIAEADMKQYSRITSTLATLPTPNDTPVLAPKIQGLYACLVSVQSKLTWVRCKVMNVKAGHITVYLLDRGTTLSTSSRFLHELPDTLKSIAPLARDCILAGVEVPPTGKWADESKACLQDLAIGSTFRANVVLRDTQNRLAVFLYREGDDDVSINEMMLSEGWGRLESNAYQRYNGSQMILDSMKQYMQYAKEDRVGIYQYGDIGFEGEE